MADKFYSLDELKQTMTRAADLLLRYDWKMWFWGDSIGLEGLLDTSERLADSKYEAFVYGLMKGWLARRDPPRPWDYTAPGVALLRLYQSCRDPHLLKAAEKHADYLASFRRTDGGAYVRYDDPEFDQRPELPEHERGTAISKPKLTKGGPCIFVDNMHFDGPFFASLYTITDDSRYRDLAVDNIMPSVQLLYDRQNHLFNHFWSERLKQPNGVFWGRGQGWGMLGIVHTLEHLPPTDPVAPTLLKVFQEQAERMAATQDASGHWHTIITDPDSYIESSVAAFVVDAFSRAIGRGWLDEPYRQVVDRAFAALLQQVSDDGKLDHVSYETYPSLHPEHYRMMPRGAMVPWGQGPLLAAIRSYCELLEASGRR
ncbi:MAG: glycoside hydrolase family 88 protein [Acidobacteriaceae bacterium]